MHARANEVTARACEVKLGKRSAIIEGGGVLRV
jgi:hypothetical protein